jgi:hypothetical protein
MTQQELPLEVEDLPLRFADLIEVLRQLTGIGLIARWTASADANPSDVPVAAMTVAGELGEPELDGNDFVIVHLDWSGIQVLLQDEASGAL